MQWLREWPQKRRTARARKVARALVRLARDVVAEGSVLGPDPTGERNQLYAHLEQLAEERERNERGRGLTSIVRQMNYVETHKLGAVAEKYGALVRKVLGRRRYSEILEEWQ